MICFRSCLGLFLTSFAFSMLKTDTEVSRTTDSVRQSSGTQRYWVEQITSGLKFPSSIVWLPGGDALILERLGGLRVLRNGRVDARQVDGLPASFQNMYNGYKDIVLDPDYVSNAALYLLLSEGTYEKHHSAVYRAEYTRTGLLNVKRIFRAKDDVGGFAANSGRMVFLPDKTLLIGVPEDDVHKIMAQKLGSHIGKMVRINSDGSIPLDNPFLRTSEALPEVWSYGHRVQTGLYSDPVTGTIWEVEPGPRGGDELNLLKAGANFGWAKATWGFDYSGVLAGPMQFGPGIENPLVIWMPSSPPVSATPSGLTRYRGRTYPLWNGDFFVGFLAGKAIERLRIDGREVVLRERMITDLDERIRDIKVGPDNYIYFLTDHENGRVLRFRPGRPHGRELNRVAHKLDRVWWSGGDPSHESLGDSVKGKQAFLERCSGCHSIGSLLQGGAIGPDLIGILGRNMGTKVGYAYSSAMAASPQVWSNVTLNLFLANPDGYVPGTSMSAPPVIDEEVRRQIIGFLERVSKTEDDGVSP